MNAAARPVPVTRPSRMSPQRWMPPALFDFWAGKLNPLWTLRQPLARLVRREPAGEGACTLVLQTNRHWRGMQPGQHVALSVEMDGRLLQRSYSPTRLGPRELSITVKAVDGGRVSQYLVHQATPGTVFPIGTAFGEFVAPTAAPLLLLAAGSGITPMRSLLRGLSARPLAAPVDLYYWERSHAAINFREELQALAAADPQLHVHLLATREGTTPAARIDTIAFDALGDVPLAQRQVLACGPDGFVSAARARLLHHVAGFQSEAFTPPAVDITAVGEVQLTLARSGRTLTVPRGKALLDSLEAHGLKPKHGCRMGICNSCTCVRASGATRHLRTGEAQDEPAMPVRICVSAPTTDLVLDL
ncbi:MULTISPECIES: ferredoxin reductase [unclassified Stenotrophomonas]|uniref:ferredoxin reductase n=1 Tax=unclassified Stenotrophomonas TaxID=196198 RepID=UPI00177F6341|nr:MULTISPECIES: ferredoxin reductase [unclassified Stenotrophomonas]MBD8634617.1 ferredoxin reductase [Stenotrophomonas sp. CFBP 13725]MBD8697729.1 ferredoxin reductase [Stenotrophomonas sp. CFBP 13718]